MNFFDRLAGVPPAQRGQKLGRDLDITQEAAWFMLQRIRHAMHTGTFNKLSGQVVAATFMPWLFRPAGKACCKAKIREHVLAGSPIFTDELKSYEQFQHEVINHAVAYVDGDIPTQRQGELLEPSEEGLVRHDISVEPFHLFRYLYDQVFRFNKRHTTDADRFVQLCSMATGKRLTWDQMTGKNSVERSGSGAGSVAEPF